MKRKAAALLAFLFIATFMGAMSTVDSLAALGLLQGDPGGFALGRPVTRAEAVVMLLHLKCETPTDAPARFHDLNGHWAESAIQYAASKHYVDGVSQTEFAPDRPITRAECCALFHLPVETADAFTREDFLNLCLQKNDRSGRDILTQEMYDAVFQPSYAQRLYNEMPHTENYMISPFSLRMALAMTANGASGETQSEILSALDIDSLADYNARAKLLLANFAVRKDITLSVANSIWLNTSNTSASFSKAFQDIIRTSYAGEARTVTDENAVKTINGWIEEKTNGKIRNMLEKSPDLAALINAIYFNGKWVHEFRETSTQPEPFTALDGTQSDIPMMFQEEEFKYYEDSAKQMLALPYEDHVTMYLLLPKTNAPLSLLTGIDKMHDETIAVTLPKFKVAYKKELTPVLNTLGIQRAFHLDAEFSPMFSGLDTGVFTESVLQQTYIRVDEEGTEAAAVTMLNQALGCAPSEFRADRPFTYFIRDDISGEILFLGEYVKPE